MRRNLYSPGWGAILIDHSNTLAASFNRIFDGRQYIILGDPCALFPFAHSRLDCRRNLRFPQVLIHTQWHRPFWNCIQLVLPLLWHKGQQGFWP
jgi:hypothetical protein